MKKTVFLAFLVVACSVNQAHSELPCDEGKLVTANSPNSAGCTAATCNGRTFCKSDVKMNWFSAWTWCSSQGLKLASFDHMCPDIPKQSNNIAGACPNLQGIESNPNEWGWSSYGFETGASALCVNLSSGAIYRVSRDIDYFRSAVCESL